MRKLAVLLIVVVCAVAQTAKVPQPAKPKPTAEANVAQGHVGKYQIFISQFARPDIYLLDTETGQIWKPFVMKQGDPEVWIYQDRVNNKQELNAWMALHNPPASAAPPQ